MIKRISEHVWRFTGTDMANAYFLDTGKNIIIDTCSRADRHLLQQFMGKIINFDKVDLVIFTHLHYDHCGNFDLFPNAEFYASKEEIDDLESDPEGTILSKDIAGRFSEKGIRIRPLPEDIEGLKAIKTPGHTRGSVCLFYPEDKVLFTGDTIFAGKQLGRTDLPTSEPSKLKGSLVRLLDCDHKILAPGHDY